MSDVSGIPYMGPMGQGNFFAPSFSYNPQMTAGQISSTYMPEIQNNQNVVNNLFNTPGGGGGFGRATDYYSALGANYSAAGMSPYGVFGPGGGGISYQGGASGAPGASINNDAWSQSVEGPNWGGGGGLFSGSLGGSQPSYSGPSIDWSGVGNVAAGLGSSAGNYDFGAGMFGGLAGGMGGAYQGPNNQLDWSSLFGGGGGGARADPYPGMSMPGGLNSPMAARQPDFNTLFADRSGGLGLQPADSSSFQRDVFDTGTSPIQGVSRNPLGGGVGGGGLDWGKATGQSYTAPATPNQYAMEGAPVAAPFNPYSGGEMVGGAGADTTPQGPRTYDLAPMFAGGGGGGFGSGGGDTAGTGDVNSGSLGGNPFSYISDPGSQQPASASDVAEQARARLAETMATLNTQQPTTESDASATPFDPRGARAEEAAAAAAAAAPAGAATDAQPGTSALYPSWSEWLSNAGKNLGNPFVSPAGAAEQPDFAIRWPGAEASPQAGASFGERFDAAGGSEPMGDASFADRFGSYDPRMDRPLPGNPYTDPQFGGSDLYAWTNQNPSGMVGPRSSAFGLDPGGFTASGAGNRFASTAPVAPEPGDVWGKVPLPAAATGAAGAGKAAGTADAAGPAATPAAAGGQVPLPRDRPAAADAPRPSGDVPAFPEAKLAPNGKEPEFFVVHHTGGGGTPESVVNDWKNGERKSQSIGTQYIMDRNGVIHDTLKEYGYGGTNHAIEFNVPGSGISTKDQGTSNKSIVGLEIIAHNEKDINASQLASLKQFAAERYPTTPFYGHGEISGNRMNDEGSRGTQVVLGSRPPAFNFDWTNAPIPDPSAGSPLRPPASIPNAGASAPGVQDAIQKMAERYGIPPQSIAANLELESTWNPRSQRNGNYGLAQINADDFVTGGGRLGGLTFEQYQRATPAQQIGAYSDFISTSPNAAYLDYGSGDPAMVSALLQAMHFSPQSAEWSNRLLAGDTSSPVTPKPQAQALGNTSIDAMRDAFARRMAGAR